MSSRAGGGRTAHFFAPNFSHVLSAVMLSKGAQYARSSIEIGKHGIRVSLFSDSSRCFTGDVELHRCGRLQKRTLFDSGVVAKGGIAARPGQPGTFNRPWTMRARPCFVHVRLGFIARCASMEKTQFAPREGKATEPVSSSVTSYGHILRQLIYEASERSPPLSILPQVARSAGLPPFSSRDDLPALGLSRNTSIKKRYRTAFSPVWQPFVNHLSPCFAY